MKTSFFIGIALAIFSVCIKASYVENSDVEERGAIENTINATLDKIIQGISDPIQISGINVEIPGTIDLPEELLIGGLNVSDLRVSGIHSIVASYIKYELLKSTINMTIDIPELYITTKWWADMTLLNLVPLYGDGRMSFTFEDIKLQISGGASLTERISLKEVRIATTIGDAVFDLHGLINNEEFSALVSTALNDNFVDFINDNQEVITNIISPVLEEVINAILSGEGPATTTVAPTTAEGSGDGSIVEEDDFHVKLFMEELESMP